MPTSTPRSPILRSRPSIRRRRSADRDRQPAAMATSDGQRFQILRPHARGGLGAVFVALDQELHREVALKQILGAIRRRSRPAGSGSWLKPRSPAGSSIPGIVPVYGLGTDAGGRPFYAMRFIRGDSLKAAIADIPRRRIAQAGSGPAVAGASAALATIRRRVPRHRLRAQPWRAAPRSRSRRTSSSASMARRWSSTGAWPRRWGDASRGMSTDERTLVPSSGSGPSGTLPGSAMGTPGYMSPEQASGDLEHLGPRSDVYSLGATLYCLLTGRAPFEGDDVARVLRAVQRGEFSPPRALDPAIDRALEAVCLKAMSLEPANRYATPKDLARRRGALAGR